MPDREELLNLGQRAQKLSPADETEAVIMCGGTNLTRFANNTIHQNVVRENTSLRVRAAFGKRVGVATTNDPSDDGVKRCVERAAVIARNQEENEDYVGMPGPATYEQVEAEVGESGTFTPEQRAEAVAEIIAVAEGSGLTASGSFSTGPQAYAVVNSHGVAAAQASADADLDITMLGETSSGRTTAGAMNVADIDVGERARVAAQKALGSANPVDVEPGDYIVVLEEDAVSDLVQFLGYMGLGGKALNEQRSFMCGKLGQQVCGENITIVDDGFDPSYSPFPFDFEGVPRQRVTLIENGVAKAVVHDRSSAAKAGAETTGHATPGTYGPFPMHLKLLPGDATIEEMIASVERGLYVTRFHYTNVAHPLRTELTGMTRDGTFLIEDGKLTKGVKNLRFTQSVLGALSAVEMIGSQPKLAEGVMVPALKVGSFRFSGATEF